MRVFPTLPFGERDGSRLLKNTIEDRRKEQLFPRKPITVKCDIDKEA